MKHLQSEDLGARIAFSVRETVALTGLSRSTIYRMFDEGRLRSLRIGGRRLIRRRDLEALLDLGGEVDDKPTGKAVEMRRRA